jgi:ATP synthase protein I
MQRVLIAQLVITLMVAAGFLALVGPREAGSALCGGMVTLVSSALLARRLRQAEGLARRSATSGAATLYLGAVQRFALVLVLLAVCLGLLKLPAIPLVLAFAAAHLGYLMGLFGPVETSHPS